MRSITFHIEIHDCIPRHLYTTRIGRSINKTLLNSDHWISYRICIASNIDKFTNVTTVLVFLRTKTYTNVYFKVGYIRN